jgi:acetolactate synthase I/III small subunit
MKNTLRKFATDIKEQTYSVLAENEPGVLCRIAGLFSARGYNIVSLAVGETMDPTISRMTIVAEGTDQVLEQINKQLNKIIPVISVKDLGREHAVSRELVIVKIKKSQGAKDFVSKNEKEYNCRVIDESPEHYIIEAVLPIESAQGFLEGLKAFTIDEICRTGQVAMSKKYTVAIKKK